MRTVRILLISLAAAGFLRDAAAQTPQDIDRAQQQNQQLIQQQQQLERQQRELDEARRRAPSGQELKPRAPAETPGKDGACSKVAEIVLEGAAKLAPAEQARLAAPYLDKCLTLSDINRLIGEITNRYVELGFVTTRVYIPQQDLGSGRLLLKIVEGRIQSLVIDPAGSASAATAFPGLVGEVLNLRDIEQGLDQINRLSSNSAKVDIEPGDEPGASRVVIRNQPRRRWLATGAVDNSGSASTGRNMLSAFLGADDLLGLNDYFSASLRHSERGGEGPQQYSDSVGFYGTVPYGYWTFTTAVNDFRYASIVQGTVSTFTTNGTSDSQMLRADRVVYRDQASKWTLGGGVTTKQTRNYITSTQIDSSSANLTVLDAGANVSLIAGGAIVSFDLAGNAGVATLGATHDDPSRPFGAPQAQYSKYTYGAAVAKRFKLGDAPFSWQSRLSGQYSSDSLYGSEAIAIGNLYTVRGFRTTSLAGNTGYFVRNDLGLELPFPNGGVRPFIGYDFGHVEAAGSLHGRTVGIEVNAWGASIQLAYSEPVSMPAFLPRENGWLYARLSLTY